MKIYSCGTHTIMECVMASTSCYFLFLICFPNPGTPAARMKKVPSNVVKQQSRELTSIFEAFIPYNGMEGRVERIWIADRNRWNSLDEMEIYK